MGAGRRHRDWRRPAAGRPGASAGSSIAAPPQAIAAAVGEGILRPISYVIVAVAVLAALATPVDAGRADMIASLRRLPQVQPI